MIYRDLEINIQINWKRRKLAIRQRINEFDLEQFKSPRGMVTPQDMWEMQKNSELRTRFIDMLSGNIAHQLTNALLKEENKDLPRPEINYKDGQVTIE